MPVASTPIPRLRARPALATLAVLWPAPLLAHGVSTGDKGYLQEVSGVLLAPFAYLGAKHMVTGYDHLLFLCGVIFFVYRLRDVATYVTLFAVGHSLTLISGVLARVTLDAYLIDAVIGLSVLYKALDNLGYFDHWFGRAPDARAVTFGFGLVHGLGLATKIHDFEVSPDGLIPNLVSFNIGVELGQLAALSVILIAMSAWRRTDAFTRTASAANWALAAAGVWLTGMQLMGFVTARGGATS